MRRPARARAKAKAAGRIDSFGRTAFRRLSTGLLVAIPALVTFWVIEITLEFVVASGEPLARLLAQFVRPISPDLARLILSDELLWAVAIVLMLALFWSLGVLANRLAGRRILDGVERRVLAIPLIDAVYGAARELVEALKREDVGMAGRRVVLIEFPGTHMKTIGFVTRTFHEITTGEELAAVYVPTTPNPTSGYVEIVPAARLVQLDWSAQEAIRFVVSGGSAGPERMRFYASDPDASPSDVPPPGEAPPPPEAPPRTASGGAPSGARDPLPAGPDR